MLEDTRKELAVLKDGKDHEAMKVMVSHQTKVKDDKINAQKKELHDVHAKLDHLSKVHQADVDKVVGQAKQLKIEKVKQQKLQ